MPTPHRAIPVTRHVFATLLMTVALLGVLSSNAQALPEGTDEPPAWTCPERERDEGAPPEPPLDELSPEERAERERRARYREVFPAYVDAVGAEPDTRLFMPVEGVRVANVANTWGAARGGGRSHEGQDIFAPAGTPVRSATDGYLWRVGERELGGKTVTVIGDGARRYYYAHLSAYAELREGQRVTPDTVLGYVGDSGNAATTPPHLHFGVYDSWEDFEPCGWSAVDPLPLLADR